MIMEKNISHIKNLYQAEVDWHGKHKFWYIGRKKDFEHLVKELLIDEDYKYALVGKNMVILDIGAYIGISAFFFHQHAKKIYAIEPYEPAFECLKRNIKENKMDKVEAFKLAIADRNGKIGFYSRSEEQAPSTNIMTLPGQPEMEVEGVTLAKFFKDNKIDHVDLLKMDIEGMEYRVFESEGFLSVADKIDWIVVEGHPLFYTSTGAEKPWILPYLLADAGFDTRSILTRKVYIDIIGGGRDERSLVMFLAKRRK